MSNQSTMEEQIEEKEERIRRYNRDSKRKYRERRKALALSASQKQSNNVNPTESELNALRMIEKERERKKIYKKKYVEAIQRKELCNNDSMQRQIVTQQRKLLQDSSTVGSNNVLENRTELNEDGINYDKW